jgi:hypothetical protein
MRSLQQAAIALCIQLFPRSGLQSTTVLKIAGIIALKRLDFMELPIVIKIATGLEGTDLENRFCTVKSPSCTRDGCKTQRSALLANSISQLGRFYTSLLRKRNRQAMQSDMDIRHLDATERRRDAMVRITDN